LTIKIKLKYCNNKIQKSFKKKNSNNLTLNYLFYIIFTPKFNLLNLILKIYKLLIKK